VVILYDFFALLGVFLSLVILLLLTHRFSHLLSPEVSRKIVHIFIGITTLTFPIIFSSSVTVWLLAIFASFLFFAIKHQRVLKANMGDAIYRIKRHSYGELYYIFGVAFTFEFASTPLFYILSIAILTFSDSAAAIIGERYGKILYPTRDGQKSVEGSLAFVAVSFIILSYGLYLFGDIALVQSFQIAAQISVGVALLEALSWHGMDNFVIPISVLVLLELLV
jgi:phytol kinase